MRASEDNIKVLLILGAILAAIGAVIDIINRAGVHNPDAQDFIGPIVVIVITVLIFIMLGILHTRHAHIPFNGLIVAIFVILEIVLSGAALFSIMGIGIILEIVAATMLAIGE